MDDLLWNTMKAEHMIAEQFGHAFGGQGRGGGNRMHLFGIAINHDASGIVRVGDRQWSDEINRDGMPGVWRNGMRLQGCMKQCTSRFGPLACRTSFNILTHVTAHARPVVVPRHEFQGLVMPGMSGDSGIMM